MINQQQFARKTDPWTSIRAGNQIDTTKVQKKAILLARAVGLKPGRTSMELASENGETNWKLRHQIGRLMSVAEKMGLVIRGLRRRCEISGKTAITWMPATNLRERITNFWE